VAHELVGATQTFGVQHPVAVDDHGVLHRAAAGQADGAQGLDVANEAEGAAVGQLGAERFFVDGQVDALTADDLAGEGDLEGHFEAVARRQAGQLVAVFDRDGVENLDVATRGFLLAAAGAVEPRIVANWVTGELAAALRGDGGESAAGSKVEPEALATLVAMVQEKKISHGSGKTVLAALVAEGGDPAAIVERDGLAQISDSGELEAIVTAAVEANPEAVEQIRSGNQRAIGAIVGAVMKETKGRADGGEVNRLIREELGL